VRKDINIPKSENIYLAVSPVKLSETQWCVNLINNGPELIENIIVVSKGYGEREGKKQETSVLRHQIDDLQPHSSKQVELITSEVFHLFNEYNCTYFLDGQLFEKKFIMMPESIKEENMIFINQLNDKGILHT